MKLWPQKKWKQILLAIFLIIIVIFAVFSAYIVINLNKDVVSGIDTIDAQGSKSALVIYQPGLSIFPKDVSYALANGLAEAGWRVEITTASSQAPKDLSNYSLLVLGFPTYGAQPGTAIVRYLEGLGNLHGINTVLVSCAAGNANESAAVMKQKVQSESGIVKESVCLTSMAPNTGGTATDVARQAGSKILP
jgi:flavorubredoxin